MSLSYYLDEDVPHPLAAALRAVGHDAESVKEHRTQGLSDARQLQLALELGRAFITYSASHYRLLHETLALWSRRWNVTEELWHHGILIMPHMSVDDLVPKIELFADRWQQIDNRLFAWNPHRGWHEVLTTDG